MSERIRVNQKIKMYVKRKALEKDLSEGEILELELFGMLSKKKR